MAKLMPKPLVPPMAPAQRKQGLAPPSHKAPSTLVAVGAASYGASTTSTTTSSKITETSEMTVTAETAGIAQVAEGSELASETAGELPGAVDSCDLGTPDEVSQVGITLGDSLAAEAGVVSSETDATSSTITSVAETSTATVALEKLTLASFMAKRPLQPPQHSQHPRPAPYKRIQHPPKQAPPQLRKHGVAGNKLVIGIDFGTTYTGYV